MSRNWLQRRMPGVAFWWSTGAQAYLNILLIASVAGFIMTDSEPQGYFFASLVFMSYTASFILGKLHELSERVS